MFISAHHRRRNFTVSFLFWARTHYFYLHTLWFNGFRVDGGRGSPKPDVDSRDLLEERVSTRGSAASPTGAHVADIYLANLNKCVSCWKQNPKTLKITHDKHLNIKLKCLVQDEKAPRVGGHPQNIPRLRKWRFWSRCQRRKWQREDSFSPCGQCPGERGRGETPRERSQHPQFSHSPFLPQDQGTDESSGNRTFCLTVLTFRTCRWRVHSYGSRRQRDAQRASATTDHWITRCFLRWSTAHRCGSLR